MPYTPPTNSITAILKLTYIKNRNFFTCFFFYLIIGGLGLLALDHGDLLIYFSENRTSFSNFFFRNATKLGEEWSYLFFVGLFLFIRFRYALLIPITGLVVTIISFLTKSFFQQPRPSVYYKELGTLADLNLVEGVQMVKGLTSFPSGHTMSAFALFTIVALFSNRKKGTAILLFLLATVVGLSRVYLMQHFLRDIYLGAILGVGIGVFLYAWQLSYSIDENSWIDRRLSYRASQ